MQVRAIACGILVVLSALSCHKQPAEHSAPAADTFQLPVLQVQSSTGPGYVELTGTVSGETQVALSTKLMSQILLLEVEEGQRVQTGEVLVRLDDSDIQAMRNEAAAYRAEAAAALAEVETVVAQGQAAKAQAEAGVKQAEAAYADAQKDYERAERLAAEDTIPKAQRDKAELGMKIAEENLNRARSGVKQAEAAIKQAEAKRPQVEAKQQQASAKDQQAFALQDYATLSAPFDGVVTRKFFEQGQLALPGQPILMLEDDRSLRVVLSVPDNLAGGLTLGQPVEVLVEQADGSQQVLSATLAVLGAAADPASHTIRAELALKPAGGLFSGRFVRARVPSGERTTLSIPQTAVVQDGELNYVWRVVAGGVLSKAAVELGTAGGGQVEVVRGLSDGDRIVSAPVPELYPGALLEGATAPEAAQ